jgi:hypothetical protein
MDPSPKTAIEDSYFKELSLDFGDFVLDVLDTAGPGGFF